jgi:hypothetical protein
MRTTTFIATMLASILFATASVAGNIVITEVRSGNGTSGETVPAPPQPIVFQARQSSDPSSERIGLTIPCLPADDPERILHYSPDDGLSRSWVITAANADEYFLDWAAFEAALNGPAAEISFGLGAPSSSGFAPAMAGASYLENFHMERIEIELDYWFWHAILPSLRAYHVEGHIYGEAHIVPEPSAWLMTAYGAAALGAMASRGAQRGEPGLQSLR